MKHLVELSWWFEPGFRSSLQGIRAPLNFGIRVEKNSTMEKAEVSEAYFDFESSGWLGA